MTGSHPSQWLSGKEAADYVGVSLPTWYRTIAPQIVGHRTTGLANSRLRYRREDLDAWLARQRVEPQSAA